MRQTIFLFLLSLAFCAITYDSVNNIIWVLGTNNGNPWTPEDIYQTCINNGWGVCYKYLEGTRPVYVFNAGLRIGDGTTYTEFSAKECTIIVDPNFVTFSNSKVVFGEESNDIGIGGVILIAKQETTTNVPAGDPNDWYCVYFRGEAYIYGSKLVCKYSGFWTGGCVAFSTWDDTTPQIIKDSILVAGNGIRFNSGNLTLIRVTMEHLGNRGDFVEFARAPKYLKDLTMRYFDYYISFYRQSGKISVHGLSAYGCPNAISLPDRADQYQEIIDMEPFYDPTQLEALRGWNMENAVVDYKFTLKLNIVDENNNPISDARVQIIDAKGNVIYDNFAPSTLNLTLTSYRAIVKSSQDPTADFSKLFGSWWWNVWIYTPFTIKVFKYGYKPFVTTIDLKRKTDFLVVLERDPIIEDLGIDENTARNLPINCNLTEKSCYISTSGTLFTETQPFDLRYLYAWTRAQYDERYFNIIQSPEVGLWVINDFRIILNQSVVWKEEDVSIKYILDTINDYGVYIKNFAKVIFGRLDSQNPIRTSRGVTLFVVSNATDFFRVDPAGELHFYSSKAILLNSTSNFAYGGNQHVYYSTIDRFRASGINSIGGLYYRVTFTNTYSSFENPGSEIKDITVSGADYGIILREGWLGEAYDLKVDPKTAGFYLDSFFGEINLTNFETTNLNRYWTGDPTKNTGKIRILYNLTIKVVDKDYNPVGGALVIVRNRLNQTVFEGYTDANGMVSTKVIAYEISGTSSTGLNADNFVNYNPFTITVYKSGFATLALTTNVTTKTFFVFPLINKSQIVSYDLIISIPSTAPPKSKVTGRIIVKNTGTIGGETRLIIRANDTSNYYNVLQFYLNPGETKSFEITLTMPNKDEAYVVVNATAIPIGAPGVDAFAKRTIKVMIITKAPTIIPLVLVILWIVGLFLL